MLCSAGRRPQELQPQGAPALSPPVGAAEGHWVPLLPVGEKVVEWRKSLPVTHTTRLSSRLQGARTSVTSSQSWTTQQREAEKSIPDPPAPQGHGLTAGADLRLARKKPGLSEKGLWLPPAVGLMPAAARDRLSWGSQEGGECCCVARPSSLPLLRDCCHASWARKLPRSTAPGMAAGERQAAEMCFLQRDVHDRVLLKNSAKDEPPYQGHSVTLLLSCLR